MKKYVLFFFLLLLFVSNIASTNITYENIRHKIHYSKCENINIPEYNDPIKVRGVFTYDKRGKFTFNGEIVFNSDKNETFPLGQLLEKGIYKIDAHMHMLSPVLITVKEDVKVKLNGKILKPQKVKKGYVFNIPGCNICMNTLKFIVLGNNKTITIVKITIKKIEILTYENLIKFILPNIDNSKGEKHFKIKIIFDEEKKISSILVLNSNFTEEEESNFIKAIKNGEVLRKENIGTSLIYKYIK
ncbi:hypothetical protein J7L48_08715 [bacterium]|nr:hypothetical protein [bacterium]